MENPDSYDANSELQRKDARELFSYMAARMTWRNQDTVMDFGCGQGFVTKNILLPLVAEKNNGAQIYGLDISKKMVNFARVHYASRSITNMVSDLLNGDVLLPAKFDKIFSSYVIHWIRDKEKLLQCFYEILNTNGEIGLFFVAYFCFFDTYPILAENPKWKSYLSDYKQFIPAAHFQPEETCQRLKKALVEIGYTVQECAVVPRKFCLETLDKLVDFGLSVNPFIFKKRIPATMLDEYRKDFRAAVISVIQIPSDSKSKIELNYSVILIQAKKSSKVLLEAESEMPFIQLQQA